MHDESPDTNEQPSKSQRKRDAEAQQRLGEQLVALDAKQLRQCTLPEALLDAILTAQKIKQHGGRKRQLQYIGKLMRQIDTAPIEASLQALQNRYHQDTAAFHRIEQWRERLLADDQATTELMALHPSIDAQQLRQLIRNARREQQQGKTAKAYRELFRLLREALSSG